jgi:tRNA(fMet)-specific endonuclease VapC
MPLLGRLRASTDQRIATTIVSVEEQMRGWLALIRRERDIHRQVSAYERLGKMFDFFEGWEIVPLDDAAATRFTVLRQQRIRIGTQDLKIAAITLEHNALLLSANLRDFEHVPGLRVENWLE